MMEKKKRNWEKGGFRRCMLCMISGMLAFAFPACSSKEAVVLEAEELVRMPEASGEENFGEGLLTETQQEEIQQEKQVEPSTLFVHICGEIVHPGVYELPVGSRVFEAVEAAGGFTQAASESYVNLALELSDGWKIEIPALGEEPEGAPNGMPEQNIEEKDDGLVDINTASKQELCTLPGVGESRAESIISYREKNGGFEKIEDIMKVDGIKEGMFSKMKDKICVRGVE